MDASGVGVCDLACVAAAATAVAAANAALDLLQLAVFTRWPPTAAVSLGLSSFPTYQKCVFENKPRSENGHFAF